MERAFRLILYSRASPCACTYCKYPTLYPHVAKGVVSRHNYLRFADQQKHQPATVVYRSLIPLLPGLFSRSVSLSSCAAFNYYQPPSKHTQQSAYLPTWLLGCRAAWLCCGTVSDSDVNASDICFDSMIISRPFLLPLNFFSLLIRYLSRQPG